MTQLGKLRSEHATTARGLFRLAALMLGSLAIASLLLGVGIFGGDSNIGGRVVMSILGVFFLLPVGLGVHGVVRGRGNAIRIYENGIAIHQRGIDTAIAWDDIESYDEGLFLSIVTKSEQSFQFGLGSVSGRSELLGALREAVIIERAVPRMKASLLEGNAGLFEADSEDERPASKREGVVDVAGFTVDVDGVTPVDSDELIPWSAITACSVEEETHVTGRLARVTSYVVVATNARRVRVIMNSTSNREACLALCRDMLGGQLNVRASSKVGVRDEG